MFILLFSSFMGCTSSHEQACLSSCEDDRSFFEACYTRFLEAGVGVTCYTDIDALGESLAEAGASNEARDEIYELWWNNDKYEECETATDIFENCL